MNYFLKFSKIFFLVITTMLVASCGKFGNNNDQPSSATQNTINAASPIKLAVIATAEPNYTGSGAHSVISCQKPREALNNILPTDTTDLSVACNGIFL